MAGLLDTAQQRLMGLLNVPTEVQRFATNPQAFLSLLGVNKLPQATGFAAGATGLPPKDILPGGVLNPPNLAYQQGYEQGEPFSYAAMASPLAKPAAKALAPKAYDMLENYMVKTGGMIPLEAWHGTPHNIQGKFDISKVGTGEGAQVYGHGMYFGEARGTGETYRKSLSGRTDLNEMPSDPAFIHAVDSFREAGYPLEAIPAEMKKAYKSATDKDIKLAIQATEKGNLYKVDIPDKHIPNMLDWDKPFTEQTPDVQKALEKLGISVDKKQLDEFDNALLKALESNENITLPKQPSNPTGAEIYQRFISGSPEATSAKLNELGIKGIRYLDEGSRGNYKAQTTYKGEPYSDVLSFKTKSQLDDFIKEKEAEGFGVKTFPQTSNFVVFDPTDVKILEKNDIPVEGLLD